MVVAAVLAPALEAVGDPYSAVKGVLVQGHEAGALLVQMVVAHQICASGDRRPVPLLVAVAVRLEKAE